MSRLIHCRRFNIFAIAWLALAASVQHCSAAPVQDKENPAPADAAKAEDTPPNPFP
ncbi:MAG: hypothetical protein H7Z17_07385, partial [Fuerstia sp.]|nr:hypothetical protein [Fuerstiella sp.]